MLNALLLLEPRWQSLVYPPDDQRDLANHVHFVAPPQSAASIRERPDLLREVDVIFTGWGMIPLDADRLTQAPRLRAIFHAAGSVRYFVTAEFWRRGITLCSAHTVNALPVAEYTLAAILFGLRHGWRQERAAFIDGAFAPDRDPPGSYGSTVALISLGAVGRLVRERLRPIDVRVIAYDPFCSPEQAAALEVELVSLADAFAQADVVSLHTPLLPETTGLVGREHFSAMRPGATFINTARGAVVREAELVAVLQQRADLHAVLDVTDPEPPPPGSPLYRLRNVVLTPHIAGTCQREAARMGRTMIEEFHRWRRGEPLQHALTEAQAARLA